MALVSFGSADKLGKCQKAGQKSHLIVNSKFPKSPFQPEGRCLHSILLPHIPIAIQNIVLKIKFRANIPKLIYIYSRGFCINLCRCSANLRIVLKSSTAMNEPWGKRCSTMLHSAQNILNIHLFYLLLNTIGTENVSNPWSHIFSVK